MIDRELLELAAKAAGYEKDWHWNHHFIMSAGGSVKEGNSWVTWNPLTDDGDALRLAVELGMRIEIDIECEDVCTYTYAQDGKRVSACENFSVSKDRFAATRRAIVRASAELGKGML